MKINTLIKVQINCENCEKNWKNKMEKKLKEDLRKVALEITKGFIEKHFLTDCDLKTLQEDLHNGENKEKDNEKSKTN